MRTITPSIQEALAKLLGAVMKARQSQDGRPFIVGHFITGRCNCSCASCLWRHNDWKDVPTDDIKNFYRQAQEEGFVAAAISGGAPFLRRDLGEIVRFMKEEAGMSILLFNTGWFIEKRMDEVAPWIDLLMFSVDSAEARRHDEIRGLNGLFDRMVSGVKAVRERYPELPVHLNTCIQQGVVDEIDDLIALAEHLGVHISFDVITESRNGGDSPFVETQSGLPLAELQVACATLLERKKEGAPIVNSERYFKYFADGKPGYRCHFPKVVMSVDGRGNVENCLNLNQPLGNIRDTALRDIMASDGFKRLRPEAEKCSCCNSPSMVDCSHVWENPNLIFESGGLALS